MYVKMNVTINSAIDVGRHIPPNVPTPFRTTTTVLFRRKRRLFFVAVH